MSIEQPFVEVAICTFNRARLLHQTLESFAALDVPPSLHWTLTVVDNGSTDDTATVCAAFDHLLPIRRILETKAGLSNARNRALQELKADYIVFTDDDVLVDRQWIRTFVDTARRWSDAAAFGGPIEPNFPVEPEPDLVAAFPALAKGFCGLDHLREEGPLPPTFPVFGANMAYRAAAVQGLLFDPNLGNTPNSQRGGEEIKFMNEIRARGGRVIWCPQMRVKHYVDPSRMTLDYLVSFYEDRGETIVRYGGLSPAPSIFGTPLWLLRQTFEAYGRYRLGALLAPRAETLSRLRQYCELRGMLRECWASRKRDLLPN